MRWKTWQHGIKLWAENTKKYCPHCCVDVNVSNISWLIKLQSWNSKKMKRRRVNFCMWIVMLLLSWLIMHIISLLCLVICWCFNVYTLCFVVYHTCLNWLFVEILISVNDQSQSFLIMIFLHTIYIRTDTEVQETKTKRIQTWRRTSEIKQVLISCCKV